MRLGRIGKLVALALALAPASAFCAPATQSPATQSPAPQSAATQSAASPATLPSAFEIRDDVPLPDPDLWQRIRLGFALEPLDSPLVADHEEWYTSRPEYIKRFVDRGSRYLHYIVEEVEKRGMPMEVALLPVIESAFTPKAQSRAKASGLWQFIPSTGRNYGLTQDWWRDNRRDIVAATRAALDYLQRLHDMFGSWELAFAAYNCGEGCVQRAIAWNAKRGLPTDYLSLKLPPETRNYVPKLIAVKNIVLSPASYGIDLESVPDEPYFTAVKAPAKIDVKLAAKLAGMTEDEFTALNPAHNKPVAVATAGTLIVPVDKAETFKENLESYDQPLVTWTTYPARRGESLDAIARKHHAAFAQLRQANDSLRLDKRGRLRAAGPVLVPIRMDAAKATRVAQLTPVLTAGTSGAPSRTSSAPHTYVVRNGDTLYAIARRFRTGVDHLAGLNDLSPTATLHIGQKLRLP